MKIGKHSRNKMRHVTKNRKPRIEYNGCTEEFNRASMTDFIKNKRGSMNTKISYIKLSLRETKRMRKNKESPWDL